ncbi:MAG: response regulator [Bacteriovoracaceae bacterium]|nr:response regulator [Halobacteriovoraceae bacterium]MDP7321095.1 response regulator [Bacteriovoracaceae bacterium]
MSFKALNKTYILLVDDEALLRDTMRTHLEIEGVIVEEASNGQQAFDLIQEKDFDIILSDIRMPECSGVELLKLIRNSSEKTPPVVLMSAFTDISAQKAKDLGAIGMFLKPDNINYLKELLVEALGEGPN